MIDVINSMFNFLASICYTVIHTLFSLSTRELHIYTMSYIADCNLDVK